MPVKSPDNFYCRTGVNPRKIHCKPAPQETIMYQVSGPDFKDILERELRNESTYRNWWGSRGGLRFQLPEEVFDVSLSS